MKKMIIALLATLSTAAAASCPDLAGTFTCQGQDGSSGQLTIEMAEDNGVVVYITEGDALYTDGREVPFQTPEVVGTVSATCNNSTVEMVTKGDIIQGGQKIGNLLGLTVIAPTETGFNQDTTVDFEVGGQKGQQKDQVVCTKN